MTSLAHAAPPVQASPALRLVRPEDLGFDDEPFLPSPVDLAWDTGFTVGLEDGQFTCPAGWDRELLVAFAVGRNAGLQERELQEARELGRSLGQSGSGISDPPSGLCPAEKSAFRRGYSEGLAEFEAKPDPEFEADRELEAWIASEGEERAALAFTTSITDFDVHPHGVC